METLRKRSLKGSKRKTPKVVGPSFLTGQRPLYSPYWPYVLVLFFSHRKRCPPPSVLAELAD